MGALKQGRIGGHPLHPFAVHIPIGLWFGSLIFDVAFLMDPDPLYATISYSCMLIGWIAALIAVASGLVELRFVPKQTKLRTLSLTHMILNIVVVVCYAVNIWLRRSDPEIVSRASVFLSIISISILSFSGYIGGLMVYRYGMGHRPEIRALPKPAPKDHDRHDRDVA